MKSSFLLTIAVSALTANVAFAQLSTKPSAEDLKRNEKTTFEKFSDRLKIGYFGVFTSPHLDDIEKGQWRNAAISPEFGNAPKGEQKNHDTWPANMWNQLSFNFNFGAKLNFVFNPRFMVPLANGRDMKQPEDRAFLMMDDFLVGFQGVLLSSDDKKFNFWVRPGIRIPTSRASRNSGQAGSGTLTHQTEFAYNATYDFNKTWQVGLFGQLRQWVIEDQYGFDRFRIYTAPFVQYTLNDSTRLMAYYENMLETNRRGKPADDRDPVFKDVWQNVMLGVSKDVTPKLTLFPYFSTYINDEPITDKSLWIGAWISYQIK